MVMNAQKKKKKKRDGNGCFIQPDRLDITPLMIRNTIL